MFPEKHLKIHLNVRMILSDKHSDNLLIYMPVYRITNRVFIVITMKWFLENLPIGLL